MVVNKSVSCSKCGKKVFYIPSTYAMNIPIVCVECHKGVKPNKSNNIQTVSGMYARVKKGKRIDIHPTYSFKSATEANFARILNLLGLEWRYEERVFTFPDRKRKPFLYIMDFEIIKGNDRFFPGFYEVKGFMNSESRNKLTLLKKVHPVEAAKTTVIVYTKYRKKEIDFCQKKGYKVFCYDELTKEFSPQIKTWE